ncbi:hypothetical protein [uncultured Roseobacter sp.]|uniref:hypothetical protein n=1 Tax=uncultured Roseobacter sp. TaxID=114847 RepID=UPI00260BE4A1|nr:hypothetical protein [uncultured Roseobacter sp.]
MSLPVFSASGEAMRLPIFLFGLGIAIVASTLLGLAAGFDSVALVIFVVIVAVVVQLAYVGLVALLAAERKHEKSRRGTSSPNATSTQASQKNEV